MKVIGFDLGGTKLASAVVDHKGKLFDYDAVPANVSAGWPSVRQQFIEKIRELKKKYPEIKAVGIASAGPLDGQKGVLLDPTNFFIGKKKTWGKIAIVSEIKKSVRMPVILENDAAAAVIAEKWVGSGKKSKNILMLTLGTGLGVGVICNGELVRGGRYLHPEGGHILIDSTDRLVQCGCGNYGCAESFVSATRFLMRAQIALKNAQLTNPELESLARNGNSAALELFDQYAFWLAHTIHNFIMLYYPEEVYISGGFSAAANLFLPKTKVEIKKLLERRLETLPILPKISVSKLGRRMGVYGAAKLAFQSQRMP